MSRLMAVSTENPRCRTVLKSVPHLEARQEHSMTMASSSVAQSLAAFACALGPADLPAEVLANAKLRLLDTVGVCLASVGMPYAEAVRGYVQEQGGHPHARLF